MKIRIVESILCALLLCNLMYAQRSFHPEADERLIEPLRNAGIQINEASLIKALKSANLGIAFRAAMLLPRFPKTPQIVEALGGASKDSRDTLALTAIGSLVTLGVIGWEDNAIARMTQMTDRSSQVELAGLLARAKRTEGWPTIRAAMAERHLVTIALENVHHLDGLKDQGGKPIDIESELESLLTTVPDTNREYINKKLTDIKTRKK